MTTAYTSLLGLALPTTGELQGTWGDTVNNSITSLLDTAVAGTTTLSTDGDVTLSTTTGAANQARQAILLCSGARTAQRTITAPAQSKIYTVINNTTGGYAVKLVGVGPTTGVTIPAGTTAQVAWNGSDFVDVSGYINGNLTVNGNVTVNGNTTLKGNTSIGDATSDTLSVTSTITSNLLFTDNTYDIGASGATRPRSLYASANGVFAGGLGLSGNAADPTNYSIVASKQMLVKGDSLGYRSVNTANTSGISVAPNTGSNNGGTVSAEGGPLVIYASGSTVAQFDTTRLGLNMPLQSTVTSTTNAVATTANLTFRNRTSASGTYMSGGLFSDTYRDVNDPCYTAGMWFERVSNGSPVTNTGGRIVFGTVPSTGDSNLPTKRMVVQPAGTVSVGFDAQIGQPLGAYIGISLLDLNGAGNFGTYGPRADITVTRTNNWKTQMNFLVNTSDTDTAPTQVGIFDTNGNFGVGATSLNLLGGTRCITIGAPTSGNYSTVELATAGTLRAYFSSNATQAYVGTSPAIPLVFSTNGTERMTIGSTGYFTFSGSNASFKAWGAGLDGVIQLASYASIFSTAALNSRWANNLYFDGTNYKQIASGSVAFASLNDNDQSFYIATQASAGAGSTVTPYAKFKVNGAVGGATSSCQIQLGPDRSGNDSTRLTMSYHSTTLSAQDFIRINNRNYGTTNHYVGGVVFSAYRDVRDPCDIAAISAYRYSAAAGLSSAGELRFHTGGGNSIEQDGILPDYKLSILIGGEAVFKTNDNSLIGVGYRVNVWGVGGSATGAQVDNNSNYNYAGYNASGSLTFSVTGSGAVSKASGSFRIPHPLPSMAETHELVHSFIEGPQADLIYRGKVTLVNGRAEVNIDTASDMTDGTFVILCREVQCFTTNESDWTPVRGSVSGNILTIESQDPSATSSISWLVIGERQDPHMMDTEWTDDNGKVIVEPLINQQGAQA